VQNEKHQDAYQTTVTILTDTLKLSMCLNEQQTCPSICRSCKLKGSRPLGIAIGIRKQTVFIKAYMKLLWLGTGLNDGI